MKNALQLSAARLRLLSLFCTGDKCLNLSLTLVQDTSASVVIFQNAAILQRKEQL